MENTSWQAIREQARLDNRDPRTWPVPSLLFGAVLAAAGLLALHMTGPVQTTAASIPTAKIAMPVGAVR